MSTETGRTPCTWDCKRLQRLCPRSRFLNNYHLFQVNTKKLKLEFSHLKPCSNPFSLGCTAPKHPTAYNDPAQLTRAWHTMHHKSLPLSPPIPGDFKEIASNKAWVKTLRPRKVSRSQLDAVSSFTQTLPLEPTKKVLRGVWKNNKQQRSWKQKRQQKKGDKFKNRNSGQFKKYTHWQLFSQFVQML